MKHAEHNAADRMKKAVQKGAVFEEEMAKFLIDREDTVPMGAVYQFKSHVSGTFLTIFDTTGRAETALAAERNKLHVATMGTCIHGTAERGIAAVDHLRDVFHYSISGMEGILNDLVVVFEYFL